MLTDFVCQLLHLVYLSRPDSGPFFVEDELKFDGEDLGELVEH